MLKRKGQTILEYTVIMIVILGVMITMKDYIKRGIQGRWKSATDDVGDQYDPQNVTSNIQYAEQVNSLSIVAVTNGYYGVIPGQWTNRVDLSNSSETKTGYSQVGD